MGTINLGTCLFHSEGIHDKTKKYNKLAVVMDSVGDTYTSRKDVPVNIEINNTDYWTKTGSTNAQINKAQSDINSLISTKADETDLKVERARINNLSTLKEGSTTGDAELIDGHVDDLGNTHKNIGEAIRTRNSQLSNEIAETKKDLGYTESYNLLNNNYSEEGFSYSNGFLSNISIDINTGKLNEGGTRYVTHPIKIKKSEKIFLLCNNPQTVTSMLGVLQYDTNGEFVQFINTNGLQGVDVERGFVRIVIGEQWVATYPYVRVSTDVYKDKPYQKYFEHYYETLENMESLTENIESLTESIESLTESMESLTEKKGLNYVPLKYEVGMFNGGGESIDVDYDCIRVAGYLSTLENELLFIYIKNGYDLIINDLSLGDMTSNRNMVFSNHLSYNSNGRNIRISVRKHDLSSISDDYKDILKVYKVKLSIAHECYDLCIASSDSPVFYKNKADIVCDGTNDQFVLQCAMYNYQNSNKVLLYSGNYYITEVRDNPYSESGLFGKKVIFNSQNPIQENISHVTHVDGYMRHIVQQESILPTTILFTKECWDSIDEEGEQVSVIGCEARNFYQRRLALHLSNINFRGYDAKKPVVFVDGYYYANMQIEKVNIMSEAETFGAYKYIPNEKHNGFRGLQGSPYGTNYIKNCLAWKCGIGYNIGGEHFVLEDCGACFCNLGFAFSHYYGRIHMQHNNVMIKCVVSQCMRSIVLDRYGLHEDNTDDLKKSTQMLECIGLQLECSFTTEGLSKYGYEDGTHQTEGIYEVHDGTWYGSITLQNINKAVSRGCKNMKITIIMCPFSGTLDNRPPIYKVANYTEYYDTENNKKYIAYNGEWRLLN